MKLSELIIALQDVLARGGDVNVYCGDMKVPGLELIEPVDPEDYALYGKRYLFVSET